MKFELYFSYLSILFQHCHSSPDNYYLGHDSVIAVLLVRTGCVPVDTAIEGERLPKYSNTPEPDEAVPTPKKVSVSEPPVAVGKVIFELGLTLFEVIVQPEEVLTTL